MLQPVITMISLQSQWSHCDHSDLVVITMISPWPQATTLERSQVHHTARAGTQTTASDQLSYTLAMITATSGHKHPLCAQLMLVHTADTGPPMHTGLLKWSTDLTRRTFPDQISVYENAFAPTGCCHSSKTRTYLMLQRYYSQPLNTTIHCG